MRMPGERDRLLKTALFFGVVAALAAFAGFVTAPNPFSIVAGIVAAAALVRALMALRPALRPDPVPVERPRQPPPPGDG